MSDLKQSIAEYMGTTLSDLATLVAYPSLAFEGYDHEPTIACGNAVSEMFRAAGFDGAELISVGPGFKAVWAEHHVSCDVATVLLYAHYDIQPAPKDEQQWKTDPWTLTRGDDGRYHGRGAADDKSGIVQHLGALHVLGGPDAITNVNLKVCIEGEEEAHGHLADYIAQDPNRFGADVYIIADTGNISVGEPILTTSLRGDVNVDVTVETVSSALHSGIFGGPTPDALVTLMNVLQSFYDEKGNTVIEGIKTGEEDGAEFPEELFREQAELLPGVELVGTGSIATRLWKRPNATVIGMDVPSLASAANIIIPKATARVAVRYPAGNDPRDVLDAVKRHISSHTPFAAKVTFTRELASPAFQTSLDTSTGELALEALGEAFEKPASTIGCGASIPLLSELQKISPEATFLLFGPEDQAEAKVHSGNESVDADEIARCIHAEALILQRISR
ncbi:MAG: M20/M25/M40 family metallo-hydrolase [Coriobacteriia bacterium]|nr:M20/M25/M40 family metallo-hydrolase [Coriobacteriia bacterium]